MPRDHLLVLQTSSHANSSSFYFQDILSASTSSQSGKHSAFSEQREEGYLPMEMVSGPPNTAPLSRRMWSAFPLVRCIVYSPSFFYSPSNLICVSMDRSNSGFLALVDCVVIGNIYFMMLVGRVV